MMEYYEEQLDITKNRIIELEKNLAVLHENILTISEQVKETQMYIMKLARNQNEITKRLSQWPFIMVPNKQNGEE